MVNGNYIMYGDKPSSESETVDDHVQMRTKERRLKRKIVRTEDELTVPKVQQRDNETDSVKCKKKVKEPKLLRYVSTGDVEENFVAEKFETYDMSAEIEDRPRRNTYMKKPKNPTDGSVNYSYSRSSSSSPSRNLPTISEYEEQFVPYRARSKASNDVSGVYYENSLTNYFSNPRESAFDSKIKYDGSHPDSLFRVSNGTGGIGDGKMKKAMRALRWPGALLLICAALAGFVFFLMPANIDPRDNVNSTDWEKGVVNAGVRLPLPKHTPHRRRTTTTEKPTTINPKSAMIDTFKKTPEVDFYDADTEKNYHVLSISDSFNPKTYRPPIPPVFPKYISPEVQYGDKDKDRTPKVFDEKNQLPEDSTLKPHITQKPEKPLAIYFKETTFDKTSEVINRAETATEIKGQEKLPAGVQKSSQRVNYVDPKPITSSEHYYPLQTSSANVPITSGHSKIFGLGIEDLDKMKSTTQSSVYNTRVSPTLPTWRDSDESTTKNYPVNLNLDAKHCQSPRLAFCRGVLPYDLAGPPTTFANGVVATSLISDFQYLVSTNCSERIKQFLCGVLEPECNPPPFPPKKPCYTLCRMVLENCDGFTNELITSVFRCEQYENSNCMSAREPCNEDEFACGDGNCISREWTCNGRHDCLNAEDEKHCDKCHPHQFRCRSGGCIDKSWMCDGIDDCPNREDESQVECLKRELTPVTSVLTTEPGEEGAGSAPAPSVRRPNTLPGDERRSEIGPDDSSKELLITSDSNNALKRNFTRRPSSSRLTPYRSKARFSEFSYTRTMPPVPFDDLEDEKPKSTEKPANKMKPFEELQQNVDVDASTKQGDVNREIKTKARPAKFLSKNSTEYDLIELHVDSSSMLRKAKEEEVAAKAELLRQPAPEVVAAEEDAREAAKAAGRGSPCPSGELRCVDGLCITLAQLCDGNIDCSDHADEDNCFT